MGGAERMRGIIDRIKRALVITILRQQMVAGERVRGAPSAWMLAGKGYEYYANFLALAMWCFEGETPACCRCRVRAKREEWRRRHPPW